MKLPYSKQKNSYRKFPRKSQKPEKRIT